MKTKCVSSNNRIHANINYTTVDGESIPGLNVHSFNPIEVFAEILLCSLAQKSLLFRIIKERHLYSWENFRGTSENHEKCKSLAQWIFPCLWYTLYLNWNTLLTLLVTLYGYIDKVKTQLWYSSILTWHLHVLYSHVVHWFLHVILRAVKMTCQMHEEYCKQI